MRRLALLEEAIGGPRVLLVGTGLRRLDVLDVFAHVFFLRPQRKDLAKCLQLLFLLAGLAVKIGQRAERFDVLRRQVERFLVVGDRLRLSTERTVRARREREGPSRVGIGREQAIDPAGRRLFFATHDGEIDPLAQVVRVVKAK